MNKFVFVSGLLLTTLAVNAAISVGPWEPLFKGVDLAAGQQMAATNGPNQQVRCLRIDLTDPDVQLFTTPKCTNCGGFEVRAENTSYFLEHYGVQVAINAGFYSTSTGPNDVPLGTPDDILGLAISRGIVVSPNNSADHVATLLFQTNNQPVYLPANLPPGTNTAGIYTAVSGNRPLLTDGVNVQTPTPDDLDPRTAFGLSEDRQYLYLLTIDGRQPGWSGGADYYSTGEWLKRFGAWDGINVDGGGSTTMSMADCRGRAVRLNRSSFVFQYGRERNIGQSLGVYARPLPNDLKDVTVVPGATTAIITWGTDFEATTQVEYGPSEAYGNATALDSRLVRRHVATLSGLTPSSDYFFRAVSTISTAEGTQIFTQSCAFTTVRSTVTTPVFGLTKSWRYTTNNLDDDTLWKTPDYDDSTWLGPDVGCLHIDSSTPPTGFSFPPRNTLLPPGFVIPIFRTYYFRTHFDFSGDTSGVSLVFSNYVDDGAVFYLNGVELRRVRMPAAPALILNSSFATGLPCQGQSQVGSGDALTICPDVFTVGGSLARNLVPGDNVVAVELHNYSSGNDVLFGSALLANLPSRFQPQLYLWMENNLATIFWNGEGFTLQQSSDLNSSENWADVPGPVTQSPVTLTNDTTMFYRLRD